MMNRPLLFRVLLSVVCVYHLLLGVAGLVFPPDLLEGVTGAVLGVAPDMDGTVRLAARFAGAYVLAFAVAAGCLARKPEHARALLPVVLTLFAVRLVNRVILFQALAEAFELSPLRNVFGVAALAVLLGGIWWSAPRAGKA